MSPRSAGDALSKMSPRNVDETTRPMNGPLLSPRAAAPSPGAARTLARGASALDGDHLPAYQLVAELIAECTNGALRSGAERLRGPLRPHRSPWRAVTLSGCPPDYPEALESALRA